MRIALPARRPLGETGQYRVTISLPEGTTPTLRLNDTLPAGLRMVSIDSIVMGAGTADGDITLDAVPTTNATLETLRLAQNVSRNDITVATGQPGIKNPEGTSFRLDFGTVVSTAATTATAPKSLVVTYTVAATNVVGNQNATSLPNSAVVSYNGTNTTPGVVASQIVEPDLTLTKTMVPANGSPVAGENLYLVTLTAAHTGTSSATAYDVTLADTLPADLEFHDWAATVPTTDNPATTGSAGVGFTAVTDGEPGDAAISVTADQLDLGETASLSFYVRIDPTHVVGNLITNTGNVAWSTLAAGTAADSARTSACAGPVASATCIERNGTGGVDDYARTSNATANSSISATKVRTSPAVGTPPDAVVVGQHVTYRIDVTIPAGTTQQLRVVDTLDAGLAFPAAAGNVVVGVPADVTPDPITLSQVADGTCLAVAAPCQSTSANARVLTMLLGDVVNSATTPRVVTITYDAVVANIPAVQFGTPTNLDNSAVVSHQPVLGVPVNTTVDAQDVVPAEPVLRTTKTMTPVTIGGEDLLRIDVVVDHAPGSNATAHDVVISDPLTGTGLSYVDPNGASAPDPDCTETGTVTCGTPNVTGSGTTAVVDATAVSIPVGAGNSATLTFWARVAPGHVVGTTITNTARVTWSSLSGSVASVCGPVDCSERTGADGLLGGGSLNDYRVQDADTFTDPTLGVAKTRTSPAVGTPPDPVVVGQHVTYRIDVTVPAGTTQQLRVIDTLDAGLAFPAAAGNVVVGVPAGVTPDPLTLSQVADGTCIAVAAPCQSTSANARVLTMLLGDVVNSTTTVKVITITYDAVVANIPAVQSGTPTNLDNSAVVSHQPVLGVPVNTTVDAQDVVPAEPVLRTTKTFTPETIGGEDLLRVEVVVDHAPGSNATAHDVVISDPLTGTGLSYVDPNGASAPDPDCTETGTVTCGTPVVTGSGTTATVSAAATSIPVGAGNSATLVFWARVAPTHVVGTTITNTARVTWTSMSGTVTSVCGPVDCSERTGADGLLGGGSLNDYRAEDADTFTDPALTMTKSRTSPVPPADDVVVGQTISYAVDIVLPAGTTEGLNLVDVLDRGLAFPGTTANVAVPAVAGLTVGAPSIAIADAPSGSDPEARQLTVDLGDVVNTTTAALTLRITYDVIVRNSEFVQAGAATDALENLATVDHDNLVTPLTDTGESVDVTEPNVTIDKTIIPVLIDAGTTATIRLDLENTGDATARGIVVEDVLPARMRRQGVAWVPAFTATCTIAGVPAGGACATVTGGAIDTVTIDVANMAPGATIRIEFNVMLDTALPPGESVSNTATVDWRSQEPGTGDSDACPGAGILCTTRTGDDGLPGPGIVDDYTGSDTDTAAGATVSNLGGFVWSDSDNDGVYDGSEACIDGVTITLTGFDLLGNAVLLSTTTGADALAVPPLACGEYRFDGLRPGTYTIVETQPASHLDGTDSIGSLAGDGGLGSAGSASTNDRFTTIQLPVGYSTTGTQFNFGELLPASIAGRVWGEENGGPEDGVYNGADQLLAGVTVTLTGTDDLGPVTRTTTTNGSGAYTFEDLRPGTYVVTETQPVDWADGDSHVGTTVGPEGTRVSTNEIGSIDLVAGDEGLAYDFHELVRVNVKVTKSVVPVPTGDVVGINTTFRWRILVENDGPSAATNVQFTDDLAALAEQHLTVQSVTPTAGTTCGAWTAVAAPNLTCVSAAIARGGSASVDLIVRADSTTPVALAQLDNDVAITAVDQVQTTTADDTDSDFVRVQDADLGVTKTVDFATRFTGERVVWTIGVRNNGPGTDPAVQLRDQVPAQAVVLGITTNRGTCVAAGGNVIDCALGQMASGDTATITVTAMLPEAGTYANVATITAPGVDRDLTNQTATSPVRVRDVNAEDCTIEDGGGAGVIAGTPGDDVICGGGGDDEITCSGGDDIIVAGGGNDTITCTPAQCAGGSPTIIAGVGADAIIVSCGGAVVDGGDGNDTVDGSDSKGPITANGGNGNDTIVGSGFADTLCGNSGNDTIRGGGANDTIDGGPGTDKVYGETGNDRLYGGTGNDLLDGGTGNDRLYGGTGNDRLYGRSGIDLLFGENGDDQIDGGVGKDSAHGGNGNDILRMVDRVADRIIGGRGRDILYRDRRVDQWATVEVLR